MGTWTVKLSFTYRSVRISIDERNKNSCNKEQCIQNSEHFSAHFIIRNQNMVLHLCAF